MRYPTVRGIAVPTSELNLPESRLDLSKPESFNTHHLEFQRRNIGRFIITQTLRDLEGMQEIMPRDVHQALHERYGEPEFPTIQQAMARISLAYDTGEQMRVWTPGEGYIYHDFTHIHRKQIAQEYNRLT